MHCKAGEAFGLAGPWQGGEAVSLRGQGARSGLGRSICSVTESGAWQLKRHFMRINWSFARLPRWKAVLTGVGEQIAMGTPQLGSGTVPHHLQWALGGCTRELGKKGLMSCNRELGFEPQKNSTVLCSFLHRKATKSWHWANPNHVIGKVGQRANTLRGEIPGTD